jgi:hypothetical protein
MNSVWAKGYCVSALGLDEEQIRKYAKWQLHKDERTDRASLWKKRFDPFRDAIKPPLLGVVVDFPASGG